MSSVLPALTKAPPDLAAWTAALRARPIPLLASSVASLAVLAEAEEARGNVDAHRVDVAIDDDPLATLWVLELAARQRHVRQVTPAETVTAAVMMLGIGRFFGATADVQVVEDLLADQPIAQDGLRAVLRRTHRAARFALGFGIHRMEPDVTLLRVAALLHDVTEMLLWCHAPALIGEVAARLQADPTLRSEAAQREVLNVSLIDLEQSLLRAWHLPERLLRLTDDHAEGIALVQPQRRLVKLSVQLARHTQSGWDNAALPDDIEELVQLLNLSPMAVRTLLGELDS
ncbi:HDOD domain-containing protein [Leptothrix sp. BB-4]